jgi:hypothetical protein
MQSLTDQSKETSESFQHADEIIIGEKRPRNDSSFAINSNDASITKDDFANQSAISGVTSLKSGARERDKKSIQEAMPIPISRQRDKEGPDLSDRNESITTKGSQLATWLNAECTSETKG